MKTPPKPGVLTRIEQEYAFKLVDAAVVYGNPSPELDALEREFQDAYTAALVEELLKMLPPLESSGEGNTP